MTCYTDNEQLAKRIEKGEAGAEEVAGIICPKGMRFWLIYWMCGEILKGSIDAVEKLRQEFLPDSLPPSIVLRLTTDGYKSHAVMDDYQGLSSKEELARLACLVRALGKE